MNLPLSVEFSILNGRVKQRVRFEMLNMNGITPAIYISRDTFFDSTGWICDHSFGIPLTAFGKFVETVGRLPGLLALL